MSEKLKYKVGDELLVRAKILEVDGKTTRYPYLLSTSNWLTKEELDRITVGAPQKPIIPRFMADIIVSLKKNDMTLYDALNIYSFDDDINKIDDWIEEHSDTFARAWLDGYEVEKEKRYKVTLKSTRQTLTKLVYKHIHFDTFKFKDEPEENIAFTKQELIDAGFGGVFDNPMFEVEEVE